MVMIVIMVQDWMICGYVTYPVAMEQGISPVHEFIYNFLLAQKDYKSLHVI